MLRPGRLTEDSGSGMVRLTVARASGAVPRDDVAAVVAALLDSPETAGLTLNPVSGDMPVTEAVRAAGRI